MGNFKDDLNEELERLRKERPPVAEARIERHASHLPLNNAQATRLAQHAADQVRHVQGTPEFSRADWVLPERERGEGGELRIGRNGRFAGKVGLVLLPTEEGIELKAWAENESGKRFHSLLKKLPSGTTDDILQDWIDRSLREAIVKFIEVVDHKKGQ